MAVGQRPRHTLSFFKATIAMVALLLPFGVHSGDGPMRRLEAALEVLSKVPSGEALLSRAVERWKFSKASELVTLLRWGAESKTDAVLTRYYNPSTGEEHRERQVVIFLKAEQAMEALVLDLAHELVHAMSRPAWDPYDASLTAAQYIRVSIEGSGGEVEAVVAECRVALELASVLGSADSIQESTQRCKHYLKIPGTHTVVVQADEVRKDFYRVGKWRIELERLLGAKELPLLSGDAPSLYSSTGRTPYPVALYREYQEITQAACENSMRRLKAQTASRSAALRAPASMTQSDPARFISLRCGRFAGT